MPVELPQQEEEKHGPPRYLVAYCALFTLLLAFFITMQSFASQRGPGLYHSGTGSFIGGLSMFGAGGVFETVGGKMLHAQTGPRYRAPEGQEEPPQMRRIDPELEDAQQAMQALEDQFQVRTATNAIGYRVELSTPCTYRPRETSLTPEEEQFLERLALLLERVVLAKGFVVRLSVPVRASEAEEAGRMSGALAAADRVRGKLVASMSEAAREVARRRIYSFVRLDSPGLGESQMPAGYLKIDILLTKPYAEQLREGGKRNESAEAS